MNTVDIYTILGQPRAILREIRRIDDQIAVIRGGYMTKSPTLSDMPKGGGHRDLGDLVGGHRDLGDLVCDLEPLIVSRRHAEQSYVAAYAAARKVIEEIPGKKSRECMRRYYLLGDTQTAIALRLDVSRSAVCHAIRRGVSRAAED